MQIGGPTGAFVVLVAGIIATYGIEGLFICTMMAGVLLVILGATGMGTAVKYIPRSVIFGFTNGIAIIIASTQIKDFLGINVDRMSGDFLGRMAALGRNDNTFVAVTSGQRNESKLAVRHQEKGKEEKVAER